MPAVGVKARDVFFNSYMSTYLLRDVGELGSIRNMQKFRVLLTALAGLTEQQVNYATLSELTGVSQPTERNGFSFWMDLGSSVFSVLLLRICSSGSCELQSFISLTQVSRASTQAGQQRRHYGRARALARFRKSCRHGVREAIRVCT